MDEFEIEGIAFKIFRQTESQVIHLNEAKNTGRNLVGTYTYDIHQPHNPTGEYHIHLRDKGNEILSMNKVSGTAHDGYHGVRIPNKAFNALKKKFPDWNWPPNQILEHEEFTYFIEPNPVFSLRPVFVPAHKDFNLNQVNSFNGFFHCFGIDSFLTGGDGGWKERTVALIENEKGEIKKVAVESFKFIDRG